MEQDGGSAGVVRVLLPVLTAVAAAAVTLVSCTSDGGGTSAQRSPGPHGGVALQAQLRPQPDGSLRVQYQVENSSEDPVILADGVPVDETSRLPQPDPDAAYVRMRAGGTLEVSRRTFDAPSGSERAGTALMRGTLLAAGESVNGTVELSSPLRLRRPYDDPTDRPEAPKSATRVVFCLGVVDPSDLEATLQGQVDADDDRPVLRHPTRQLLLCSPETDLSV